MIFVLRRFQQAGILFPIAVTEQFLEYILFQLLSHHEISVLFLTGLMHSKIDKNDSNVSIEALDIKECSEESPRTPFQQCMAVAQST